MRYLAFVSYAHRDTRWARWLHRTIETYALPRAVRRARDIPARPGRLFLDRSELSSSPDLSAAIQEALGEAANLVLVCSPAAAASRWVNEEVRRFRTLRGRERVFCLIVDGDPALRDGPGGCFPPALLEPLPGDPHPVEPLAADVRPGQDGRAAARLKLVAGLLDLPFDALRQRDQARRMRRLTAFAVGAGIVAAALLALSVVAVLSRDEARRQAQTATQTTNFLTGLLTSVDPGDARGHDPTVRALVDRGVAEIAAAPELDGQPRVRASLMTTLAQAYATLGQYRAAEALVERAAKVDRSDPRVAVRQDALRAAIANADGRFGDARNLVNRALAADATDPAARTLMLLDRAAAERGLGDDAAADATLADARARSLALRPPDREGADQALWRIAERRLAQGRYDEARRDYAALLRSRARLGDLRDDPVSALAYNSLGAISYRQGDDAAAARYFGRALAADVRLLGPDHPTVATIKGNLARILVEGRRFAPALVMLAEARAAVLVQHGPAQAVLASQDDTLGLARAATGDPAGAEAAFRRGLAVARALPGAGVGGKKGDLLVDLSALLCGTGRAAAAPPLLDEAARAYAAAPATPAWMRARAGQVRGACLMAAGDRAAGAALVRAHAPAALAHWGRDSLFGADAAAALAAAQ